MPGAVGEWLGDKERAVWGVGSDLLCDGDEDGDEDGVGLLAGGKVGA
jgi:hypothetical protein